MRVLLTLLYMCTVSVSLGMRLIPIDVRRSSDFLGNSTKLIPLEDRQIYLNKFYKLRTTNEQNKQRKIDELSNEMHKKYKDELTFEEMRTILGAPKDGYYQEGDDLCENLYRIEIGAPLRFGHMCYTHDIIRNYETHMHVIKKVIEVTKQNYACYLE